MRRFMPPQKQQSPAFPSPRHCVHRESGPDCQICVAFQKASWPAGQAPPSANRMPPECSGRRGCLCKGFRQRCALSRRSAKAGAQEMPLPAVGSIRPTAALRRATRSAEVKRNLPGAQAGADADRGAWRGIMRMARWASLPPRRWRMTAPIARMARPGAGITAAARMA